MTQLLTLGASFPVPQSVGQLALKFHWVKMCFGILCVSAVSTLKIILLQCIFRSAMPKPVYLLTVQEAQKGVQLLGQSNMGQIWAIRFWWVWSSWHPSSQRLNLPTAKGPHSSSIEEHFSDLNYRQAVLVRVWRMQLCSHRYVRITGLLSAPLVLRIVWTP